MSELNDIKMKLITETEEALAEVERKLVEDRPQLTSDYGKVFWELMENLQLFELFTYSIKMPQTPAILQKNVHPPLHIHSLFTPFQFAALQGKQLGIYDIKTQQTTQHTLSKDFGTVSYIEVDRRTLMIVGNEVIILDLYTFQMSTMASLLIPRSGPGVAKVDNYVFAFGGYASKVCEKWSVLSTHWTRLPDMHYDRYSFAPCFFQSFIYLAGTYSNHYTMESFCPQTETFTVLPVSLPQQLTLNSYSVAYIVEISPLSGFRGFWRAVHPY